jgi:hypothetical protein
MRRSRLLGLVAAVALVTAGITWVLVAFAVKPGSASAQTSSQPQASVRSSLTPVQRATVFGGPDAVLDVLGFGPQEKQFVRGIVALAKAQQATAYADPDAVLATLRLDPEFKTFVKGITSMAQAQQTAASGRAGTALDRLGFDPEFKQFVTGITSMANAQQPAASGR